MTEKSDSAFRTISEAADEIGVPAHVLRFWETRFPQLQPLKRAGGRRYYRPADMGLLRQIRTLLHDQGMTIRGAQLALTGKTVVARSIGGNGADQPAPAAPAFAQLTAASPAVGIDRAALVAIRNRLAAALAA